MDFTVASTSAVLLILAVLGYVSLVYLFSPKYDPREPPVLPHLIPYVGHIIGLLRNGPKYFEMLSMKNSKLPIFTLQTLNKRTYIVTSAELVPAVERNERTISFMPFVSAMSPRLFDIPSHGPTMDIIKQNLHKDDGDWGLVHETDRGMRTAMAPGTTNLDNMHRNMLSIMEKYFDELAAANEQSTIKLFEWIRPRFTVASTEAIYGPGNPFKLQPELGNDFWDFDRDFTTILLGVAPRFLASKGWKARQRIVGAIKAYFARGDDKDGLGVLTARRDVGKKYGASIDEISRFEVGDAIGVLVNATPTLFWTLLQIYSDPTLLADIRAEIEASMTTQTPADGPRKHIIDINTLQDGCPLLLSTYREVLRTRTQAPTSRWVTQDTIIANQYLLKKDSALLIPGALIHADPVWGPDAKEFNPKRFIGKTDVKAGANRTWGGGQTLCPGRFFATMEITCSVAMFVARFDVEPVGNGGKWVIPKQDGNSIASSIHPPKTDVKVRVTERNEYQGGEWAYRFADKAAGS